MTSDMVTDYEKINISYIVEENFNKGSTLIVENNELCIRN